jgi:hypothetical protein
VKQKKKNDFTEDKIKGYREDLRMLLQARAGCDKKAKAAIDNAINKIRMKLQRPLIELEEEKPKPKSPYDEQ